MSTYIVLLRGVNVGGKNILPMKELRLLLEEGGFTDVRTYIQSGNIILSSDAEPGNETGDLIHGKFGFTPEVRVLSEQAFRRAVANNPYAEYEGKTVHFYFCKAAPAINHEKLEKLTADTEAHELIGNVFYLHAPEGIGRSKLVANIEACLGVSVTGRNLNTISKLAGMLL